MRSVTATELHDRTAELTEQVMKSPEDPIVIEKRGKAAVVLVDARYFEGLLETLDILSDPDAMAAIRRGLADIEAGRLIDHEDVLRELGLHENADRYRAMVRRGAGGAARNRKPNRPRKNRRQGVRAGNNP
jgi:antitoxin YefM